MTDRPHRSIGEVLHLLEGEFPEVTISKIRFLESQGLLNPERTPSGYRMFFDADVARLRWILVQQRDNFLPLRVIKKRLDSGDWDPNDVEPLTSGEPAPESTTFARVVEPVAAEPAAGESVAAVPVESDAAAPVASAPVAAETDDTRQVVQLDSIVAEPVPSVADSMLNGTAPSADDSTYLGFEDDDDDVASVEEPVEEVAAPQQSVPQQSAPVIRAQPADAVPTQTEPAAETAAQAAPIAQTPAPVAEAPVASTPAPTPVAEASVASTPAPTPVTEASVASTPAPTPVTEAPAAPTAASAPVAEASAAPTAASAPVAEAPVAPAHAPIVAPPPQAPPALAEPAVVSGAPPTSMSEPLHPPVLPEPAPDTEQPAVLAGSQAEIAFSITELAEAANLEVTDLRELQRFGIIEAINDEQVPHFDADALMVARAAAAFMSHGLEPRHLKAWRVAAEREAGVLEQLTLPVAKQNSAGASRRALELANDLVSMGSDLRYAMLRRALRKSLKFD